MRNTSRTGTGPEHAARGNFTPPGREEPAPPQPDPVPPGRRGRLSPSGWRVRTRLTVIALVPAVVALVVGGLNVDAGVQRWQQADEAVRTARLVRAATDYGNALLEERDTTARPLLAGRRSDPVVRTARAVTDAAAGRFDAAADAMPHTPALEHRLAGFRTVERKLTGLRDDAYTSSLPGVRTEEAYTAIQHPLAEFANELGFGTTDPGAYGRTLYAMSLTKGAESLTRSIGTQILVEHGVPQAQRRAQLTALASYAYLENIALEEFRGGGTPQDVTLLTRAQQAAARAGDAQVATARTRAAVAGRPFVTPPSRQAMLEAIASGMPAAQLTAHGITADSWNTASTLAFGAYRSVEGDLASQAGRDAASVAAGARRQALTDAAFVVLGVLASFAVAALMARSMGRTMRRLRGAALEVAEQRLPALVEQLSRDRPGRVETRVEPIPIGDGDEIGEVARAFDQVHRQAVRLAAEQALLRGNVNAIFTNLSLRNQGLIERQLALITGLENNEADPDQLASLFRLDHLATRMRRNGENLLVLAGEEPGRRWSRPVPVVDVLRAAASEVEAYERIEITGVPAGEIHGDAVTGLVHLLAELLENATSFSSPHTRVRMTATRLPDGRIAVEIHDMGIGLSAQDFADINHRLATAPVLDAEVPQRMGLFVVGRLAARHGIRVQLRPSGEQAGTTSLVMLPVEITQGGGGELLEDDFTVSRIVPEHREQAYESGQFTAAQLGFDDGRYEVAAPLDAVGRSLLQEGRRAALEAAAGERLAIGSGPAEFAGQDGPGSHTPPGAPQDFPGIPPVEPQSTAFRGPFSGPVAPAGDLSAPGGEMTTPGGYRGTPGQYGLDGTPAATGRHSRTAAELPPPPTADPSGPGPLPPAPERVGYDAPDGGPVPGDGPRRPPTGEPGRDGAAAELGGTAGGQPANNELWHRAALARAPKAGGVTPSGLPQRVPQANLVAGAAQPAPQTGPLVSRDPQDVRGRLTSLRHGVRQGRGAGNDPTSSPPDRQGPGPNHQER